MCITLLAEGVQYTHNLPMLLRPLGPSHSFPVVSACLLPDLISAFCLSVVLYAPRVFIAEKGLIVWCSDTRLYRVA